MICVVQGDRRTGVQSDIRALSCRKSAALCHLNSILPDFLAVHEQSAGAALSGTASIIGKVENDCCLAGHERLVGSYSEPLQTQEIVVVGWLAILNVEAPAAEAATLGDQYAIGRPVRHNDICCDRQ